MKLTKKSWGIAAAITLVVSSVGLGTTLSYIRTAHSQVGKAIRDATPLTFELKRLETMTTDLIPLIRTNQRVAAQLDTEFEYLTREVDELRKSQEEALSQMKKLRGDLQGQQAEFRYGDRTFSRSEVEKDLAHRLDRYDQIQEQMAAKEKIQIAQKKTLDAAIDNIRQYEYQRDLLVEKGHSLQAELKLAEAAQAEGAFQFDQSKMSQAKLLALEVEKKIRTLQKVADADRTFDGDIPVEVDTRPVMQRFDEQFAAKP